MKKYLVYLLASTLLINPTIVFASIPGGTVWEVRTAGSDTNGGGFIGGITSISSKTDLVVSGTSNLKVSSTSYGFTSADVGRYLKVTSGTNWRVGSYLIVSVSSGVATLNLSPAAINTTAGSFTMYYGVDYSQQNAVNSSGNNISTTDLVTNGTTTVTSATATFTPDIVGNIIYITGGTGSITAGWYEVASYTNATTIVLDRSTGLTTGTGATLNIGGALATFNKLSSNMVASNKAFIRGGTYTTTSAITFSQSSIYIYGYGTVRGDATQPILQASTTTNFTVATFSGGTIYIANLAVDCNSLASTTCISFTANPGVAVNLKASNFGTFGISTVPSARIINAEVMGGLSGSTAGITVSSNTGGFITNSYVHDSASAGIDANSELYGGNISRNIIINMSGASSDCIRTGGAAVNSNIGYNCGRDGLRFSGNFIVDSMRNNIFVNNAGYGFNSSATAFSPNYLMDGNAYYNNTLGTRHNLDDITVSSSNNNGISPYTVSHDIILTGDPFVNASGANFALNNTGGAGGALRATGIPSSWPGLSGTTAYPDMGPVQHQCSSTTGSTNCPF